MNKNRFRLKAQQVVYDETTIRNWIMGWLDTMPRFVRWGIKLVFYNGGIPIGDTGRWRRQGGKWWKAGVSDLHFMYRGRSAYIETKRSKGGTISREQAEFISEVMAKGGFAMKASHIDEVIGPLTEWMDRVDKEEETLQRLRDAKER